MKKQNDKKDERRYNATITTDLALLALVLEVVLIICFDMFARDNLFGNRNFLILISINILCWVNSSISD